MVSPAEYLPHARAERLIASARATFALFALVALILDPSEPAHYAALTRTVVTVYTAYAIACLAVVRRRGALGPTLALWTHAVDLGTAAAATALTQGSGSPFFMFFTFPLLCATLRWQRRGALVTGALVVSTYVAFGAATAAGAVPVRDFELNRFIIRFASLVVITTVLARVGAYEERLRHELGRLARWPRTLPDSLDDLLTTTLAYAAGTLQARCAGLVWEQDDEPFTEIALWRDGRLERRREPPRRLTEIVTNDIAGIEDFDIDTALVAPLGSRTSGWLIASGRDPRSITPDDLMLAQIVAGELGATLDQWSLRERLRAAAVSEERLRVARDLHDGTLQSLTGCRLALTAVANDLTASPLVADRLRTLERIVAAEQHELRRFIHRLRPAARAHTAKPGAAAALEAVCERIERHWGFRPALTVAPDVVCPTPLLSELSLMVHEALVNVAKHAGASAVSVSVSRDGRGLRLTVCDDGCGFGFRGRYDGTELGRLQMGPRSIRERAEALGGRVTVESSSSGARVEVVLPGESDERCA